MVTGTLTGSGGMGDGRRREQGNFKPVGAIGVVVLGSVIVRHDVRSRPIDRLRSFRSHSDIVGCGCAGLVLNGISPAGAELGSGNVTVKVPARLTPISRSPALAA